MEQPASPVSPVSRATPALARKAQLVATLAALGLAVVMAAAARAYERPPPPEPAPMPGITVAENRITVEQGSAPWKQLKIQPAVASQARHTSPIPARVAVNDRRASRVGVPVDGRVTAIQAELGQPVKTGDVLFTIQSPTLADLAAEESKAQVDLDAARVALERVHAMVVDRLASEREEAAAERDVKQAQVALQLAQRKRSLYRAEGSDNVYTVHAPRTGVVVEKNLLTGQEVRASGDALMVLADLSEVWVLADVYGEEAQGVKPGMEAVVVTMSAPGQSIRGVVDMVSAVVDPQRHSIPVRVRVENKGGVLRPNDQARVRLLSAPDPGSTDVPASALVSDGEKTYVYVEESPGHFVKRSVVAGPVHDATLTVLSGLSAGERVVVEGALLLDNQIQLESN